MEGKATKDMYSCKNTAASSNTATIQSVHSAPRDQQKEDQLRLERSNSWDGRSLGSVSANASHFLVPVQNLHVDKAHGYK
jgi:hypothetical protein